MLEMLHARRFAWAGLVSAFSLCAASLLIAAEPSREILGLSLAMTKDAARARLQEIGTFERDERKQQEIWKVRDPSFSHVIIAFNKEGHVRFITAVAREDKEAKRVRYGDVAPLDRARQAGDVAVKNFNFRWDLPAGENGPAAELSARGRDSEFLSTYSIKRAAE